MNEYQHSTTCLSAEFSLWKILYQLCWHWFQEPVPANGNDERLVSLLSRLVVSEPHTIMLLVTSPRTARSCLHCKLGVQNRHSFLTKHFEFLKLHLKMGSEWEWQRTIRYRTCPTQLPPVSLLSIQFNEWHKPQADSLLFCSLRGLGGESTHSSVSSPVKAHCISTKIASTRHLMHRQLALISTTVTPAPRTD